MRKNGAAIFAITVIGLGVLIGFSTTAYALSTIDSTDIIDFPSSPPVGSGNGLLDIILFLEASGGGVAGNDKGTAQPGFPTGINVDDANTDLPTGGKIDSVNESWVTTMGELQDFYKYTFPDGSGGSLVNEIVIFVDVNETGPTNQFELSTLDIITGYNGSLPNPVGSDLTSATQNGISPGTVDDPGTIDTGGTLDGALGGVPAPPFSLRVINNGAGKPDQFILTGINPFSYSANTKVLFHWISTAHDDGGETVFLSGEFRREDLTDGHGQEPNGVIPEPSSLFLLGSGLFGLFGFGSKRRFSLK